MGAFKTVSTGNNPSPWIVPAFGLELLVQPHGGERFVLGEPSLDLLGIAIELGGAGRGRADLALERRVALGAARLELLEQPPHGVAMNAQGAADRALSQLRRANR